MVKHAWFSIEAATDHEIFLPSWVKATIFVLLCRTMHGCAGL